jgi:hypothetical protein
MATLTVGPGEQYSTIQAAVAASGNSDVIEVEAGTYTNNFVTITHNITLEAVGGGMVNMVETKPPPNLKGMITIGNATSAPNVTITGFEISGVSIPAADGGNGAAIRYQSGNLKLNDDWFHNNQDGLLATPFVTGAGSITIKSHAENNTIENNRIFDNNSTASYSIDLPNGGDDTVSGNIIEKGLRSATDKMILFLEAPGSDQPAVGSDNEHWANSSLQVSDNTFVNDKTTSGVTAVWNDDTIPAPVTVSDNSFWNVNLATAVLGPASLSGSVDPATPPTLNTQHPWLISCSDPKHPQPASSSTASSSTCAPCARCSGAVYSRGLCVIPSRLGTNSIALGHSAAISTESCPAAAMMSRVVSCRRAALSRSKARSRGSKATGPKLA